MFKKLFKGKSIGFYLSLAASVFSLALLIFYAVYMSEHKLFNGGVFTLYLFAFLLPLVYFFIKENDFTCLIPIAQAILLAAGLGITALQVGNLIVFWLSNTQAISGSTADGGVLMTLLIINACVMLVAIVGSFIRQTRPLTAAQQAEVDESWSEFKSNTKTFAVAHKKPLIAGGAGLVVVIIALVLVLTLVLPQALIVHVKGITLDKDSVVLYETETQKITATIDPVDAENPEYTFVSGDEDVATVSAGGLITAKGVGKTTITVTSEDGNFKDECAVEVKALAVQETIVKSQPVTTHYLKGAALDPTGIAIQAKLTNSKIEEVTEKNHNLRYNLTTVDEKEQELIATYTYRGADYSVKVCDVYGDIFEVHTAEEFLANYQKTDEYGYLRCTQEMTFDSLNFTGDITIEGEIRVGEITVAQGVNVEVVGRVWSKQEGDMTISGAGSLDITQWAPANGTRGRLEYAAIRTDGKLTVTGTTLAVSNIATGGDVTISDGAKVTVLGKNASGTEGAGGSVNGVHASGFKVTISGKGTELNVLFNAPERSYNPGAFEAAQIIVDGGKLTVDSNYAGSTWVYPIWFYGNEPLLRVVNGGEAFFNVPGTSNFALFGDGVGSFAVESDDQSEITIICDSGRNTDNVSDPNGYITWQK